MADEEKTWIQQKYESFWLYPESHPWRLGQHIALRGVLTGSTLGFLGGLPFVLWKRRGHVLTSLGRITFRGALVGGRVMGLVVAERLYSLDKVGAEDRSYRIAYNWGQTKWDYIALNGAVISMAFLRHPFGGTLPATAVGVALGSLVYIGATVSDKVTRRKKTQLDKVEQ